MAGLAGSQARGTRPVRLPIPAPLLLIGLLLLQPLEALANDVPRRRMILAFGENRGGPHDVPLRFAERDARRFLDALMDTGGGERRHTRLLAGGSAGDLEAFLKAAALDMQRDRWGEHDELVVYVSAHAADGRLHLAGTYVPIRVLKDFIEVAPAGLAMLVLDTCQAGAAVRQKGLEPRPGTVTSVIEPGLEGRVILASSGPNEVSLESDDVDGSFFTHHLVTGLRGPADASQDGRITLQEAYAYAYVKTLDSTMFSLAERQTPQFALELRGEGEWVLTQPGHGRARVRLDFPEPAEIVLMPLRGGGTVERFGKAEGIAVYAVPPGPYRLRLLEGDAARQIDVVVPAEGEAVIRSGDLKRARRVVTRRKGFGALAWTVSAGGGAGLSTLPEHLGLVPGGRVGLRLHDPGGLLGARSTYSLSLGLKGGTSRQYETFSQVEVDTAVGLGLEFPFRPVVLYAGIETGAVFVRQFGLPEAAALGAQPFAGLRAGVAFHVTPRVSLESALTAGAAWVNRATGWVATPMLTGTLGVAVEVH